MKRPKIITSPIDNRAAFVSMLFLGLVLVVVGYFSNDISIMLKENNVTDYFQIILALISYVIVTAELGLKIYTPISKLKKLSNQQLVTFATANIVVLSSILVTMYPSIEFLTIFNSGLFMAQGFTIMLEAVR